MHFLVAEEVSKIGSPLGAANKILGGIFNAWNLVVLDPKIHIVRILLSNQR